MDTAYTRTLLDLLLALQHATEKAEPADCQVLFSLLPPDFDLSPYRRSGYFDQDALCLFNECIIDLHEQYRDALEAENPQAAALLARDLSDILEAFTPGLRQEDLVQWAEFKAELKQLCVKLKDSIKTKRYE